MNKCKQISYWFLLATIGLIGLTTLFCGVASASPVKIVFVGYDSEGDGVYEAGGMASCTHIGDGYYLTNNHVIAPRDGAESTDWEIAILDNDDGRSYTAKYHGTFAPFDLAILQSPHVAAEAYTVRPQSYKSVSPYYINTWQHCEDDEADFESLYGDFDYIHSEGTVIEEWYDEEDKLSGVVLTALVRPGNSGGAIVDSQGYLVGLVSAMRLENRTDPSGPCITVSGERFGRACSQLTTICEGWRPPLYIWTSGDCVFCREFEKDAFFSQNNFLQLLEERFHLIKVDTDQNPGIRSHLNPSLRIETLPTFVRGDTGQRLEGYGGMRELLEFLDIDANRLVEGQTAPQPPPPTIRTGRT